MFEAASIPLAKRMERGRRVAPRCPRRYDEQCAAEAAGTRKLSSREMRFGPARMRVGKPVNCYPSQAPSERDSGDSVTRGCGRDAGIFNLERHRATTASRTDSGSPRASSANRLHVRGKSLYEGDTKMHVRGVTYGTFRPDEETSDFPSVESVAEDFAGMAANGVNAVRTYTVPPRWLLDLASEHRLYVMVGLPWEEHVDVPRRPQADRRDRGARARDGALLRGPSGDPLLRDRQRDPGLDRALARQAADRALPEAALPRGEERGPGRARHLRELPEHRVPLAAVHRPRVLQRVPRVGPAVRVLPRPAAAHRRRPPAGGHRGRPRLAAQLRGGPGAGARLAGPDRLRRAAAPGMFVFSWTDEWYRGGSEIDDWAFGLVDRNRTPKQALATVGKAYRPGAVRAGPGLAARLGGRLRVQQREHAAQLLRRPARPRLPGLRGDRRQRRLDRRDGRDHRRVRLPADQHREPRAVERAQRRPARPPRARSSPTWTRTRARTRTGCATSRPRS